MRQYFDVVAMVLELAETTQEGLEHVRAKLNGGEADGTAVVMGDVLEAFARIQDSLRPLFPSLPDNRIKPLSDRLAKSFDLVVTAYEGEQWAKVQEVVQFILLPNYKQWRSELDRCLKPYVVS